MPGGAGALAAEEAQNFFDIGSYLGGDGGPTLLDGWNASGTEGRSRAQDSSQPERPQPQDNPGQLGEGRDNLLPDDVLDFFGMTFFGNNQSEPASTPDKCTTSAHAPGASAERVESERHTSTAPASQSKDSEDKSQGAAPRKRKLEDPSVLEMARKLVEARKGEQSAALAKETKSLCADNHRLIGYLRQLGERLTKARVENTVLKEMVAQSGGQARMHYFAIFICMYRYLYKGGHAELAQIRAAVEGNPSSKKPMMKTSTLSVADKVSALSVQHLKRHEDGHPVQCMRAAVPVAPAEPVKLENESRPTNSNIAADESP
eukprot:scaffold261172_cov44-Prasinocladus_malaysianus.AAC.1